MSRTNPYKLKKRQANSTLLLFGEGLGEETFLKYLRGIYSCDCNVAISIKKGKGGDPKSIVVDASKIPGSFDRRIVILDNDKSELEMENARCEAKRKRIELIENFPCLESLLLNVLGENKKGNSLFCKSEFESKYITKQKRCDVNEYKKIFPKSLLERKRKSITVLDRLISVMEGK